MTPQQKLIGETAISQPHAQNFGVIQEEVSHLTGINLAEVTKTLDFLAGEFIIRLCTNPARNVLEAARPQDELTWAWYEQGARWPKTPTHNAVRDGTLFDVRQVGTKFAWHVFDNGTRANYNGECGTLEEAKAAAEHVAGCKPEEWTPQSR